MNRDLKRQIAAGDKIISAHAMLDLYTDDLHILLDKAMETRNADDILTAVADAYKAGLAIGTRHGKRKAAAYGR